MTRILYLAELLTTGGTAKHLSELLPRLRKHGIEPYVLMRGEFGKYAQSLKDSGIPVYQSNGYGDIRKLVKENRIDAVHSYLYGPHIGDAIICRLLRIPYIKSTRNQGHWFHNRFAVNARVKLRSYLIKHHLTNSDGVKEYLIEREGINNNKITVIKNGMVDRRGGDSDVVSRDDLGLSCKFVLVSLSWLKPHKRVDKIIDLLSVLIPLHPNMALLIIGSGPLEDELKNHARKKNVEKQCVFLGKVEEPYKCLSACDLLVSASENEGLSNAFIESQMMGVPCALNVLAGGNAEIIEHSKNGFLYSNDQMDDLLEFIKDLYEDEDKLVAFKKSSRERFVEEFSVDRQVNEFIEFYTHVLKH
jgi:glycosyltransferase involved in cell wall biosynthesis